ncbi:non-ribosomal peptide synthetase [Clostridium sp. BNL1100]|uniref:non-ribosomal peptide synthetase n=1 Tax=Clostridium sp. BNL1100 TaxID=755731 RepID=UPI00024A7996|nr:non-ribosomal peptide synthetase [Clostridium sp. BNL1100]AEY67418.1 amino acid adenylation enzyme/thioester reductase family protein [Clostridium sp. BNL1100]
MGIDEKSKDNNVFPLTNVQTAYLMGRNPVFELGGRSTHIYYEFENNLDIGKFNTALNKLIKNQPMLRAVIESTGQQRILDEVPEYIVERFDLTNLSNEERQKFILNKRVEMSHHVFKIDTWPLFDIKMAQLDNDKVYMFCDFDLLIADAGSLIVLINEVMDCYDLETEPIPLEASFRDYVYKLVDIKKTKRYQMDRDFWMEQLAEFPSAPQLPLKSNKKILLPKFKRLGTTIDSSTWGKIKEMAEEKKIQPTIILCTAYAMVLEHWCNQDSFTINSAITGRSKHDKSISRVIGDFTKALLLPIQKSDIAKDDFWENATAIRDLFATSYKHSYFDGMEFLKELSKARGLGTSAVMPIVFTSMIFNDEKFSLLDKFGELKYGISQTPQVFLDCQVMDISGKLLMTWDYVEEGFEEELITTMFKQYEELVLSIKTDGSYSKEIFELSDEDKKLIQKYNDTVCNTKKTTLQNIVSKALETYSNKIAIKDGNSSVTYKELDLLTDRIAISLQSEGIGPGDFVGISASRCTETVINILGVIKSGAAYVPINPEHPRERQNYIYQHSGCKKMLESAYIHSISEDTCKQFVSDEKAQPTDIAYVIYTSGSTGEPKGVVISNEAVCNTIIDINSRYNITGNDKVIGISSFCFDLSVYDIFGSILAGAELYIAGNARNIPELIAIVAKEKITVWNTVPAIMELYIDELYRIEENKCDSDYGTLRVVMLSGDWIPVSLPNKIKGKYPQAKIYSLGGATEASIWSIHYPIDKVNENWTSIPYGYPLANQMFYVLDSNLELCPVGVIGELYIGGIGVATGYQNDIDKTNTAFMEHKSFGRIYKTGDFGVMNRKGYIEFKGRKDEQVKIRGHRIELGEIESVLIRHEAVENVAVIDYKDETGKVFLCAYIVSNSTFKDDELPNWAATYLPDYMVPRQYVKIDEIPLTSNGKVNKKILPKPEIKQSETNYMAPRNDLEMELVQLWQEVLNIDKVGINDDFFDLGGDSLNVIKVITKASEIGIRISLDDMYKYTTILSLAPYTSRSSSIATDNIMKLRKSMDSLANYKPDVKYEKDYKEYLDGLKEIQIQEGVSYNNIFITGGTGFLGSHLVRELLFKTKSKVYILVRGENENNAEERLRRTWSHYFKENDYINEYSDRVSIIVGDISQVNLGLSQVEFDYLAETVDCIIHAAATINHYGLWEDYQKINIDGTRRITEFSKYKNKKDLHYISTISTGFSISRYENKNLFSEHEITRGNKSDIAYAQSKIYAEEIALAAQNEGINVKVYRLGFLVQSYKDGIFQTNEGESSIFSVLSMMMKLGSVPNLDAKIFDLTFVDQAAEAITLLLGVKEGSNIYHIFNPYKISLIDFAQLFNEFSEVVKIKSIDDFEKYLANGGKKYNHLVAEIINLGLLEKSFDPTMLLLPTCKRTETILRKCGFEWGQVDSKRSADVLRIVNRIAENIPDVL